MMERTLILVKPDAVQRQLIGAILARFEAKGMKVVGLKMLQVSRDLAERMYEMHRGKDFYEPLLKFVTAGPSVAMVLEGVGAIDIARSLMGDTFGPDATPGTIRGDYAASRRYNLVHGSDSPASADREIPMFFTNAELADYELTGTRWVYAEADGKLI